MIFKESRLKAEQESITNLNEESSQNTGINNYPELLGLSYTNNYHNLVPSRFKWGRSMIKVVD